MTIDKGKILLFFIFIIISSIMWLLTSLEEIYTTQLKIPIKITGYDQNKFIKSGNIFNLSITINGYGYDIVKYSLKNKLSILQINLNNIKLYPLKSRDTNNFYFLTKDLSLQISAQIDPNLKILNISPDTIFLTFSQLISKHIPIKPNIHITYAKQYINKNPIQIEPNKTLAQGPSYIIDSLSYIPTKKIEINNLSYSIKEKIPLKPPNNVKVIPKYTTLIIEVEQYTEARLTIPIKIINLPAKYNLLLFPDKINVRFNVGIENYKKIQAKHFTAVVDYKDIEKLPGDKLPVKIIHKPNNIYSFSYFPYSVEYILEEKQ